MKVARESCARQFGDACLDLHDQTGVQAWGETLNMADRFQLTVYDAAYLELAERRTLPLATLDAELRAAAKALGVRLVETDDP